MSQLTKTCAWCLTEYQTFRAESLYCSPQHKEQAREYRKRKRRQNPDGSRPTSQIVIERKLFTPIVATECRLCGDVFVSIYLTKLYCSDRCKDRYRKTSKGIDRIKYRDTRRTDTFKSKLYWKAQGLCGICKQPIDTSIPYPEPMSFSVDHIIPVSKGGSERNENLQASHLSCNIAKGAL
jgi:5-methylcytosine-specific restriction endonuclease McrA